MRAPIAPPPEMADCERAEGGCWARYPGKGRAGITITDMPMGGGVCDKSCRLRRRRRLTLYPLPPLPSAPRAPINAPPSVPARAAVRCVREEGRKEGRKEERKE